MTQDPSLPPGSYHTDWYGLRRALVQQRLNQRTPSTNAQLGTGTPQGERPIIQRVFDYLTAPLAGVTEMFEEGIAEQKAAQGAGPNDTLTFLEGLQGLGRGLNNVGAIGRGFSEAISGEPDYGGEVIRQWLGAEGRANIDSGLERTGVGLAVLGSDIALDPLTYIPFGAISKAGRSATKAIPDEYLSRSADELAAITNPNTAKTTGTSNRYVRTRDIPEPPAGQRIFEAGTSGPARVINTPRQRAARLVDAGSSRPSTISGMDPRSGTSGVTSVDVARAADVPDLTPASVLPEEQVAKINRLANRTVRVKNIATQPQQLVAKYGQRWKQSAINNGQDPVAVEAGWNAVKADIDRMVGEVEEVVRRLPEDQQAAYRQVGLNHIVVDTQKVLGEAAEQAMTARELTERIAARRAEGGLANASGQTPTPVEAPMNAPEAKAVDPETVAPATTPVDDIGRQLDEAAQTAEINSATQAAADVKKIVKVRPSGKSGQVVRMELDNEVGPHVKHLTSRVGRAVRAVIGGHKRTPTQKQYNAVRTQVKDLVKRRIDHMEKFSKGRYNQMEQGQLWDEVIKMLRGTDGKPGIYGQFGLKWKEEASEAMAARELFLAADAYLSDMAAPTVWNGLRAGSRARWNMPVAGKAQKLNNNGTNNINAHFSLGQLLSEMPDDVLRAVMAGSTKTLEGNMPYSVAVMNAAAWKSEEALRYIPKQAYSWLLNYDSAAHMQRRAAAYANIQNPAANAAIESTARNMEQSAATKSGPEILQDAQKAENAAATATASAGGDTLTTTKAGKEAGEVADDIAVEAVHGTSTAGRETYRRRKALLNENKSKRGAARANEASAKIQAEVNKSYNAASIAKIKSDPAMRGKVSPVNNVQGHIIDPEPVDAGFMERMGHWFRTEYKKETIFPTFQNSYGFMHEMQSAIGVRWNNFAQKYITPRNPQDQVALNEVFEVFRGTTPVDNLSPRAQEIWSDLSNWMDSVGIPNGREFLSGTAIGKAGLDMNHVNSWIKVQHVPGKGGRQRFYFTESDDILWPESIYGPEGLFKGVETVDDLENVVREMHAIENAVTAASMERWFVDDFIARGFGTRKLGEAQKGWVRIEAKNTPENPHVNPYFDGVFVHPDIAKEVDYMVRFMKDIKEPSKSGAFLNTFDFILRSFKTGVTIYNPQHHVRNMVGDVWLHMADQPSGIGLTRRVSSDYSTASRIMNKYRHIWSKDEFGVVGAGEDFLRGQANLTASTGTKITVKNGDIVFNDADIVGAFHRRGLAIPAENIEDLIQVANTENSMMRFLNDPRLPWGGSLRSPAKGNVHNIASNVSQKREHFARMAHFVRGIRDTKVPANIKKRGDAAVRNYILDEAVRRVRKFHPDGLDLTRAERNVGRRIIPFYSWQRKSIPLIMLALARRPTLFTMERKLNDAFGTATGEQEDYLPGNQLFPTWLRGNAMSASLGMQTGQDNQGNLAMGHRLMQGPGTPGTDLLEMVLGDSVTPTQIPTELTRDVASQTNPIGRVPAELLGNRSWRTGAEINSSRTANGFFDYAEYLAENTGVPYAGVLTRGATNRNPWNVDLANFLTAASVIDTAGYDTAAQLSEREQQAYLRDRRGQ